MRLSRWTAVAAVPLAVAVFSLRATAQQPLRVVRHAPVDTARSGDVITISFDRPVAGSPERSGDPTRFVHVEPALAAVVQWRDPVTLRVLPREPLAPDIRLRVTVDTSFTAIDGGRLAAPYSFTIVTRGPAMLASVPRLYPDGGSLLDPSGRLQLAYSAPTDAAEFARVARLEIERTSECVARVIRYSVRTQRVIDETDDWSLRAAGGWDRDTIGDRFRRVVELRPREALPEGCRGALVLPSLDSTDHREIRYRIATQPPFALERFDCAHADCAAGELLRLFFTAPVHRDSLLPRLRLEPAVPFTVEPSSAPTSWLALRLRITPRTTYRVSIDSTLTDVFGRRITGKLVATLETGDRHPALGHQLGFFSVSRANPVLRITHVNVDGAELVIVPIPDSLRMMILDAGSDPDSVARTVRRLRDTVRRVVALRAPFNEERITEIPIPPATLGGSGGSLFAIRARRIVPSRGRAPDKARGDTEIEPIEVIADRADSLLPPRPAIVQLTDLMAHAKVADGWGAVLVTNANGGRPVPGARVSVRDARDSTIATGTTDATGVAALRASPTWRASSDEPPERNRFDRGWPYGVAARLIEVARGTDRSLTLVPAGHYYDPSVQSVDRLGGYFTKARLARAGVYADREIYRPGEQVYLSAILRRGSLGELRVPSAGDSVRLRVSRQARNDAESEVVRDTVLHANEFGTVADSFSLGRTLPLGNYHVRLDAFTDGWSGAGSTGFQLAEYRAPEFEATLAVDTTIHYLGDSVSARATGRYYFGAPMGGAVVRWRASTTRAYGQFAVPGLPAGFMIGQTYDVGGQHRPPEYQAASSVDTLDATGAVSFRIPTVPAVITAPAAMQVDIAVEDVNRRAVTAQESTILHASDFYIAVRDSGSYSPWPRSTPRSIEVLAVRPDGERVGGVPVRVSVVRHGVTYVDRGDGSAPAVRWASDTISRDSVVTAGAIVRYRFVPRTDGQYEVIFAARDGRGRRLITSLGGYVGRPWVNPWSQNLVHLALDTGRDTLVSGDTAVITFDSPFARAEAWVTVERERLLWQRRFRVDAGKATVRIPVSDRFVPGAHVAVVLVDSGSAWGTDSVHRRMRAGYGTIAVSRQAKVLAVTVRPERREYAPGDSARITVTVRDYEGRPAVGQVTLWAVDEGVLALAGFARPDPVRALYLGSGTGLAFAITSTSLASLKRLLSPPGWRLSLYGSRALSAQMLAMSVAMADARGGFRDAGAELIARSNFRTTAFYLPTLATDSSGAVTAAVKLPDNLTTYRVMAVAVTRDDRYGSGESTLVLTKRLLARASLPRFLRAGDEFIAGAAVNNTTGDSLTVRVRASGRAVTRTGPGDTARTLANGAASEVRFNWRSNGSPGDTAVFRFDVVGGPNGDAVEASLPIRAPYSPRYHAVAGVVRDGATVTMMLPRDIDPARSRLTLRVGTSPVPAIRAAYARMSVYAYQCSEQLASTGQVLLALLRLQRAGVLDSSAAPDARTLRGRLQYVVDELTRRQSATGGIGYWSADTWTTRSLSAYAGLLLLDARAAGAKVDARVIDGLVRFARLIPDSTTLRDAETYGTRAQREYAVRWLLAEDLAALQFLRRAAAADSARENRLLADQARMTWEDRVWLTELLAARADPAPARAQLARVWRDVEVAGTRVDVPDSLLRTLGFPSHVRPIARLVRATMAVGADDMRLAMLVERVVQQGRAERDRLWNTQDYAAATSVLADVAIAQRRAASPATVLVRPARAGSDDRVLVRGAAESAPEAAVPLDGLLSPDGEWMALPLRIEVSGAPVFYVLTVDEVPLRPPTTPDARGIIVERWFERFEDGRPVTEVKEGELVRGRLRITVPSDREFVAVEDLLPAGLEVVDLSLRTSSTLGPFESEASERAERAGDRANPERSSLPWLYGTWVGGWWSPWEHTELRDDRVSYFARVLWKGSYTASYVARAMTAGTFVRPPAHAEEMYNPSLGGRSEGGTFTVRPK